MVGTEQLRQIALGDGTLTLSGVEALPGGERYHQLQWQREAIGGYKGTSRSAGLALERGFSLLAL
jgi:hypothetical protein